MAGTKVVAMSYYWQFRTATLALSDQDAVSRGVAWNKNFSNHYLGVNNSYTTTWNFSAYHDDDWAAGGCSSFEEFYIQHDGLIVSNQDTNEAFLEADPYIPELTNWLTVYVLPLLRRNRDPPLCLNHFFVAAQESRIQLLQADRRIMLVFPQVLFRWEIENQSRLW